MQITISQQPLCSKLKAKNFFCLMWLFVHYTGYASEHPIYRYEFEAEGKEFLYCDVTVANPEGTEKYRIEKVQPIYSTFPNLNIGALCRLEQPTPAFEYLLPKRVSPVDHSSFLLSESSSLSLMESHPDVLTTEPPPDELPTDELPPPSTEEPESPIAPESSETEEEVNPMEESKYIPKGTSSYPTFRGGGIIGANFYLGSEALDASAGLSKYTGSNTIAGTRIDFAFCMNPQDGCSASWEGAAEMHTFRIAGENGRVDEPTAKSFRRVHLHHLIHYHAQLQEKFWLSPGLGMRVSQIPFFRSESNPDGQSEMTGGWFVETLIGLRINYLFGETQKKYNDKDEIESFSSESRWELGIYNFPSSVFGDASAKSMLVDWKYIWQRGCNEYLFGLSNHKQNLKKAFECTSGTENCNRESTSNLQRNVIFMGIRQSLD